MKPTENFKRVIFQYLEQRAKTDDLFAPRFANPQKNIDDCITYILNTVKKSGCNGFVDDEIYNMAIHYYDEENIEVGGDVKCTVVSNHIVELTEEDKKEAREQAMEQLIEEQKKSIKMAKTKPVQKEQKEIPVQTSLLLE